MIRELRAARLAHGRAERRGLQRGRRPDDAGHRLPRRRGPQARGPDPASTAPVRASRAPRSRADQLAAGTYSTQVAAYRSRFPTLPAERRVHRRHGHVRAVGGCRCSRTWPGATASTSSARTTRRRSASRPTPRRSTVRDPDLPRPSSVFVATGPEVYNEAFLWAPARLRRGPAAAAQRGAAEQEGAAHRRSSRRCSSRTARPPARTPIENLRPYRLPGTAARARLRHEPAGVRLRRPARGRRSVLGHGKYYMRCLDRLGANVVMQDEANPGPWASDAPFWQPLDWMRSTWRAASDPTVSSPTT